MDSDMGNGGTTMSESEKDLALSGKPEIRKRNYAELEIASWDEEIDWDEVHRSRLAAEAAAAEYRAQHPEA